MSLDSQNYTASIHYDKRLYNQDIMGSIAHVRMLARQDIVTEEDAGKIESALLEIKTEIEQGSFPWHVELEDIHMNIEARLFEKIGDIAGRLHTGRSRNDQIALDIRMYTKEMVDQTVDSINELRSALVTKAEENPRVVMPGYTHVQRAQPVLFAHHMLAYFEMFGRDVRRFKQVKHNADVMPLGSGAIAGVPYHIDRDWVAHHLGFESVSSNSMDAVSDRDFLIDYQAASAVCMMHLSRLGEELILWSSDEFKFARLDDEHTTGSSMMPQKRNPDFAEIARGKTGRVYGNLMSILTILKGLPLAYNRDMQEDKEGFFDTVDTLLLTTKVFTGMISKMLIYPERMRDAARGSYLLATDVADYLVDKGIPFREAHSIVADLSSYALEEGKHFDELSLDAYRRFSDVFGMDVFEITVDTSVADRDVIGGTAFGRVSIAIGAAKEELDSERDQNVRN
ncbi:MAG: argininosuccinate lyase [Chloroflexota bacterium]|nr:argininosuccinate lyase [Chloroflexota bacterium]